MELERVYMYDTQKKKDVESNIRERLTGIPILFLYCLFSGCREKGVTLRCFFEKDLEVNFVGDDWIKGMFKFYLTIPFPPSRDDIDYLVRTCKEVCSMDKESDL